jgi:hypothetical protein
MPARETTDTLATIEERRRLSDAALQSQNLRILGPDFCVHRATVPGPLGSGPVSSADVGFDSVSSGEEVRVTSMVDHARHFQLS